MTGPGNAPVLLAETRTTGARPGPLNPRPAEPRSLGLGRLDPGRLSATSRRVAGTAANLVGAAGAALFAQATLREDLRSHSWIGTAFLVEQTWVVIAYLIRRPARVVSRRSGDWVLAFVGTFGGVLFRPGGAHLRIGLDAGLWIQLTGLAICMASFLALGRSFGFAAADRGLVNRGPYGVVRHPIYASYLLLQLGYLLQSLSVRNALVMVLASGCNVGRVMVEERLLASGPEYRAYMVRVPWRLVPGLW